MRFFKIFIIVFLMVLGAGKAKAESAKSYLIVDSSGSMWGQIDGTAKYLIAKDSLQKFLRSAYGSSDFGMIAYGHRSKSSCDDIQIVAQPGELSHRNALSKLEKIVPKGKTPLTAAVEKAANELMNVGGQTNIVLFTDGLETCGGDLCALAEELKKSSVGLKANVIGFDLKEGDDKQLRCLADATGGVYVEASSPEELEAAFLEVEKEIVECPVCDFTPIIEDYESKLDEQASDFEQRIDSQKEVIVDVRNQLADKKAYADDLQGKINGLEKANLGLTGRLNDTSIKLNDCEDNTSELLIKLANAERENRGLDEQVSQCELAKTQLGQQLQIANDKIAGLDSDVVDLEKALEIAKAENSNLTKSNRALTVKLEAAKDELFDITNKYNSLKVKYDSLFSKNNATEADLVNAKSRLEDLEDKNKEIELANIEVKKANLDLSQRIKDLEEELANTKNANEQLLNKIKASVQNLVGTINEELGVSKPVADSVDACEYR